GPMPQTRFVLSKAIETGLKPIVVVNKCDRPDARPNEVVNEVFDLLVELGAEDHALDFPIIYASGRSGWAAMAPTAPQAGAGNMKAVYEAILNHVPAPKDDETQPLQMLVTTLDYNDYVGKIGIGRVFSGKLRPGVQVASMKRDGSVRPDKV